MLPPARNLYRPARRWLSYSLSSSNPVPLPHLLTPIRPAWHKSLSLKQHFEAASFCRLHTSPCVRQTDSKNQEIISQMSMRHVNENSFLSWCRNAYLSTAVGAAMITEGTSALAQSAGLGALLVGTMNLTWGTGCHVTNLIRLRHVSGMSRLTLFLHLAGSSLHCVLWAFVLLCYIGFLDEARWPAKDTENDGSTETGKRKKSPDNGLPRV